MTASRRIFEFRLAPVTGVAVSNPPASPTSAPPSSSASIPTPMTVGVTSSTPCSSSRRSRWPTDWRGLVWPLTGDRRVRWPNLPWVEVVGEGADEPEFITSSRAEAHRTRRCVRPPPRPTATSPSPTPFWRGSASKRRSRWITTGSSDEVFSADPLSVLHGVFFAVGKWPFQPKIHPSRDGFRGGRWTFAGRTRVGSSQMTLLHSLGDTKLSAESGYGDGAPPPGGVDGPRSLVMSVSVDRPPARDNPACLIEAVELLETIAAWELAQLLRTGLRFRTACDLQVVDESGAPVDLDQVADTAGELLGTPDELAATIGSLAARCSELDDAESPHTVVWSVDRGRKAKDT